MQLLKIALPLLAVLYVVISPAVAMPLWNKLMFFPTHGDHEYYHIEAVNGFARQDISIESSHKSKLHGWFFRQPDSDKIAIINHGNGGSIIHRLHLIDALLKSGVSVLAYDYQGYGKSTGSPSVPNICDDGDAAYNYAVNRLGYTGKNVILVGESLGCAVSTRVARRHECAAVILQSGFSSLPEIAKEHFAVLKIYPNLLFPHPMLDNAANLREIHVPVLVIHGSNDEVIPRWHGEKNFAAANEPKTLCMLKGAHHNDCSQVTGPEFQQAFVSFIQSLSGASPQSVQAENPASGVGSPAASEQADPAQTEEKQAARTTSHAG